MNQFFPEMFAGDIYKQCFREIVPNNREVGDGEKEELEKCVSKYHESYKVVAQAFVTYVSSLPNKKVATED